MNIIGNLLWIIFGGGIFLFFGYVIGGIALCLTIIGIPFGFQCFKIGLLALSPFGQKVVTRESHSGCLAVVMNVIWLLTGGLTVAITHLVFGVLMFITIIGIPFANQHMKLTALALTPFGKDLESN